MSECDAEIYDKIYKCKFYDSSDIVLQLINSM